MTLPDINKDNIMPTDSSRNKFKLGMIVTSKVTGTTGVVVEDPLIEGKLVVQIHPFIFGNIDDSVWEITYVG